MKHRGDIYNKTAKAEPTVFNPTPAAGPPPHRKAFILFGIMAALVVGVAALFNWGRTGEDDNPFGFSLTAPSTNLIATATNRNAATMPAVDALLTDLGDSTQAPPPTLSPQKMAEAMSYVRSAQQYIRSRDMDGAERETLKALEVWPDMNLAVRLLGSIYTQRGQFDQAVLLLEKSLNREPFSAETLNNLAINYMQKGMMSRAEELLNTSLQIRPEYGVAYINLGFIHLRLGRYDLAIENFEAGLKQMPENTGVLNNLAVCLIRMGDYEGARARLEELIQLAPNRATAYFNMAISYVLEQNTEAAFEWIRRGADACTPSQLQAYLSDADFDAIRSHPDFQQILRERFPNIPSRPPTP
jgi:Flp pilus assembly protein TadD